MAARHLFINSFLLLFLFISFTQQRAMNPKETLYKYGYLKSLNPDEDTMKKAVKMYQEYTDLPATGNLDQATMEQMSKPRCGMPDKEQPALDAASKWRKRDLTYTIRNRTEALTKSQIKQVFEGAIRSWTENVNLRISELRSNGADIDVYFNDQDGRSNVLGYAYFPENGDIYFDIAEEWVLTRRRGSGIIADWLVGHELGHALGLEHADTMRSIMYPYYNTEVLQPSMIDMRNIRELYGGAPVLDSSLLCKKTSVDAMLYTNTNDHMLIKDKQFWYFTEESLKSGPHSLDRLFPGLPTNIQAGFTRKKTTYFLKDNIFYKFKNKRRSYTKKLISVGFENVPSNIDAVFFDSDSDIIYFLKGTKYYMFDINKPIGQRLMIDGKEISDQWPGVPSNIEAASYLGNDKVLLIKKSKCYTVRLSSKKLLQNRDCTSSFFRCEN